MTRAPSAAAPGPRIAALHAQGDRLRLVVVESAGAGAIRIVQAESFAKSDASALAVTLAASGAARLVRISASAACVCRVIELPDAGGPDVAGALALLAEAELPESAPEHRRGAGLLAFDAPGGGRRALLAAWTGDANAGIERPAPEIPESWTAEPAALLALLELAARAGATSGAALAADHETGSIGVAASGPGKVVVRALRESPRAAGWSKRLESRWNQTAAAAGISEKFAPPAPVEGFTFFIAEGTRAALADSIVGALPDERWLSDYGVALGAACLALRSGTGAGGLCGMTPAPIVPRRTPVQRLALTLARPATAVRVIAAGLILALLIPLGAQALRHTLLVSRSGGLNEQQSAEREQMLLAAFYQQLERRRWPMTKLMADLSGALPVGVTVESLRLEPGQRISVRGRSDSLDLVNQLQSRLNDSGVFAEVTIDRTQFGDNDVLEFDLSGRVGQPFAQAKGIEDFSTNTLARRLYGERADLIPASDAGSAPAPSGRAAGRDSAAPARSRAEPAAPSGASRAAEPPPAALSDDQIAAMDASTAMKEWTSRLRASKQPGLDETTKQRLAEEAEKCRARMQAARREGGSS